MVITTFAVRKDTSEWMFVLLLTARYFHVSMDYLLLGRDPSRNQFQNELQAAIDHLEKIKGLL